MQIAALVSGKAGRTDEANADLSAAQEPLHRTWTEPSNATAPRARRAVRAVVARGKASKTPRARHKSPDGTPRPQELAAERAALRDRTPHAELCPPVKCAHTQKTAEQQFRVKHELQLQLDRELSAKCSHFENLRAKHAACLPDEQTRSISTGTDTVETANASMSSRSEKELLQSRMLGFYKTHKASIQQTLDMYETLAVELKSIKARLLEATKQMSKVAPGDEIAEKS